MMLEGFRRYDLYENCKDLNCQFSLKVTHYHCTRENCGYKFCGRTHMYKHAQHHDRVDNLVLDDFKRFKSTLSCHFPDCQFSGNSTHFHCLRCGFRCTDSTKVTAHRKHHGKQDVITAAGFCQFSSSADCEVADCKYKLKCSHFHCTFPECRHTVVGMSQMDSHKRKHERRHIRSATGVMGGGLSSSASSSAFLVPKDEPEESSNDDLMDFSAISSKNSSLSASPTATQPSGVLPHLLSSAPAATTTSGAMAAAVSSSSSSCSPSSGHALKPPTPSLSQQQQHRMSSLLAQALPSNMPVGLALSNNALVAAAAAAASGNPFYPLMPRMPLQLPHSAASLISAVASAAHSVPGDALAGQGCSSAGAEGAMASTPTSFAASSIMEKLSASKGLISPMMARLAAAALKPSGGHDTGKDPPAAPPL
jgi:hypothetical protein